MPSLFCHAWRDKLSATRKNNLYVASLEGITITTLLPAPQRKYSLTYARMAIALDDSRLCSSRTR